MCLGCKHNSKGLYFSQESYLTPALKRTEKYDVQFCEVGAHLNSSRVCLLKECHQSLQQVRRMQQL